MLIVLLISTLINGLIEGGPTPVGICSVAGEHRLFNPIISSLYLNSIYPGGGKFAPPWFLRVLGVVVSIFGHNLISYSD